MNNDSRRLERKRFTSACFTSVLHFQSKFWSDFGSDYHCKSESASYRAVSRCNTGMTIVCSSACVSKFDITGLQIVLRLSNGSSVQSPVSSTL